MATKTNKLGLSKAELTDAVRSTLVANNGNFDIIDDQIARLKANQPKATASGTEIVVEDSAEMESNLHISGNSEQDSRSGKNILKDYGDVYAVTIDDENWITANIDNTSGTAAVYGRFSYYDNSNLIEAGGKYKVILEVKEVEYTSNDALPEIKANDNYDGTKARIKTYLNKKANTLSNNSIYTYDVSAVDDVSISNVSLKSIVYCPVGSSIKVTFRLTLTADTTVTADTFVYEPYGAMPSPDYPSEIRSVKSKSDNLLPNEVTSQTVNGVTLTLNEDKSFVLNGTATAKAVFILASGTEDPLDVGTYMLSLGEKGQTGVALGAKLDASDGTTKYIFTGSKTKWDLDKAYTLTRSYLDVESGTTLNKFVVKPMLRKGDKLLPYQPYGYIPVVASVEGKNIAKINETDWTLVDNAIESKARNSGATIATFKIKAGQTIIAKLKMLSSHSQDTSFTGYVNGVVENNLGFFRIDTAVVGNIVTRTYTATEDCEIKWICWGNANSEKMKFQLWATLDSNPLEDYEPYLEPNIVSIPLGDIELRSTPDGTRDTFERVDGVWNYRGDITREIYDGSDNSTLFINGLLDKTVRVDTLALTNGKAISENKCLCSRFTLAYADNSDYEHARNGDAQYPTTFIFYIGKDKVGNPTTKDEALTGVKTWLASNPIEVTYPLATPTYTPITDQTLIQALDELEQLILHKGYNRITVTSVNGVKAYLDLSYTKDINILLNNIITKLGGV